MTKFTEYLTEEQQLMNDMASLVEFAAFIEDYSYIREGKISDLGKKVKNEIFPKLGITIKKRDSFFALLGKSSKWIGQMLYHSFMAYYNNDEMHKEKVKELQSKVKKADFIDFLIRLDHITLHMIAEPIHLIDAITGWHIKADISKFGKQVEHKVKQAVDSLDDLAQSVSIDVKKTVARYSNAIRRMFDVGEFAKVGRDL